MNAPLVATPYPANARWAEWHTQQLEPDDLNYGFDAAEEAAHAYWDGLSEAEQEAACRRLEAGLPL